VSQAITLSTTGGDAFFTRVTVGDAAADGSGLSVTGGSNPIFNDPSVTDGRTLSGTLSTAGTYNTSLTLTTTGEGLVGETPINVSIGYQGQVFSGQAKWTSAASSSWGTNANWTDVIAPVVHSAPGGYAGYNDSMTLDNSSSVRTVNLDGATPHLSSLSFNTTSGSGYLLAQGSGGAITLDNGASPVTVTVTHGSQTISAPLELLSDVAFAPASGGSLTVSGDIDDSGSGKNLAVTDAGSVTLSGTNTYLGVTSVSAGTLEFSGVASMPAAGVLLVEDNGVVNFDSGLGVAGAGSFALPLAHASHVSAASATVTAGTIAPVPEPGTLALLAAAGLFGEGVWLRRKKTFRP
jgi:autotransporter-associated beta strand protein